MSTFKYSVSLSPSVPSLDPDQRFQQGLALHQKGMLSEARAIYTEVLQACPAHADSLHLLGVIELHFQAAARARELIARSIAIFPNNPASHLNLGNAERLLLHLDAALGCYDRALALKPDYASAFAAKGVVLHAQARWAESFACFAKAIAINPAGFDAYFNLGNAQKDAGQFEAAIASYNEAIARNGGYVEAYLSRCAVYMELGRFDAVIDSFNAAIAVDPTYPKSYWNKAMALLLAGHYGEGLELYEWRWKLGVFAGRRPRFSAPPWLGVEALEGKTILLHAEQGLGDTLQFCRYAKLVSALGARVVLEVQAPLLDLLKTLEGPSEVIAFGDQLPDFDLHCPLLSLPLAFRTTVGTIPASASYVQSDARRVQKWSERLGSKGLPRVGLVWSGNKALVDDHTRSISLASLMDHLPAGIEYVSLQKEIRSEDEFTLGSLGTVRHFGVELVDFSDTAALCELMDVVISVDTSVAHLSGALGKKTWVLLSHLPDWRWLTHRTDSPWYPQASLYRQSIAGQWLPVLQKVGADLSALLPIV